MTMTLTQDAAFWNKIAEKYARDPIGDMENYDATLDRVRSHLTPTDRILEIGCGTGTTAVKLADSVGDYLATDISSEMCRLGEGRAQEAGLSNLHFATGVIEDGTLTPPGSMDAVLSFNHLHLVEDPARTLHAAHAALRPGGLLIAKTVCMSETWKLRLLRPLIGIMTLFGKAPSTVRFFSVDEHDRMVEDAGFEIVETGFYAHPRRFVVARKT